MRHCNIYTVNTCLLFHIPPPLHVYDDQRFLLDIVERAISSSDKNAALDSNYNDHLRPTKDKRKKLRCSEFEYQDTHGSTMITEVSEKGRLAAGGGAEGKMREEWRERGKGIARS